MLSEKELRELAADILKKISEAQMEGDEEKVKHLMRAYDLVASLLAEMEEKRIMWEQFLRDIKRVVEEPPRREGEGEEKVEERRRFARRLYEMAEEGLGINPVREAIRAIRSHLRKATIEVVRLAKQRRGVWPPVSAEWLEENASLPLRKQFVGEEEEERQWLRKRALDIIESAKYYLEELEEGMLEDIIYNRLRDIVSGVSVDLGDLSDNIRQARELLVSLELQMEKEKPDIEMVNGICDTLKTLLQPLQGRIRQVFEETKEQVEAARERIKLPSLGEQQLRRIATILDSLSEVVDKIPQYAKELRKPIRKPRAPKVKPRFGWLP